MALGRTVMFLLMGVVRTLFFTLRHALKMVFWITRRTLARRSESHGSARWATLLDLVRIGAWGRRSGLIIAKKWGGFIRHRGDGAALVYAPMGSGKGVGLVVPNLLDYPGAVICTDPKGENVALTGRWRASLGRNWQLNPLCPKKSHHFNPFDLIRIGTHHEADDAALIADLLVMPEATDTHWDTSAKALIAALIRYILHSRPPALRCLSTLRELVAAHGDELARTFEDMAQSPIASVAEEGRVTLAGLGGDEMTSIIKNTAKSLGFWSRDRIGGMLTARSDFDFLDMHREVMTAYIVVPEEKLAVYRPFLRLMMGCALAAAVRGKQFPTPKHKPLLLIDECAALGPLEALATGLGYLRAYARTLLVFQDLGQLRRLYGNHGARTFMAASGCQVAFNVNDNETARELAESIGTTTVLSRSEGASQASTDILRQQLQAGAAESSRYLLDASEVRRLSNDRCLVFLSGCRPLRARKVRYYNVMRWKTRWDAWRDGALRSKHP